MIQWLIPTLGGGDGDTQIFLNPCLPDEVTKAPRPETGVKGCVLGARFTRYDTSYATTSIE